MTSEENSTQSEQHQTEELTPENIQSGTVVETDGELFIVTRNLTDDLVLIPICSFTPGFDDIETDAVVIDSETGKEILNRGSVQTVGSHVPEGYVQVTGVTASTAADEINWVLKQFDDQALDDPQGLRKARDELWNAVGHEQDENERA